MKTLLIILAVFSACIICSSGGLVGTKKCTYGPSYWCDSIINAKECRAVKHCIQTIWETKQLPDDNDDICTICKNMVQEARDTLQSNETQDEIRQVFEGSCKLIPIRVVRDECIKLSDDFIPELVETLASQMNPQMVCATAGLCNSIRMDKLLKSYQDTRDEDNAITAVKSLQNHPEPGDCEACTTFVKDTIRIVTTHSKVEVLHRLMAICGRLGSLSDGCMTIVESNLDEIYNYLTQELNPDDVCNLVGMCERMFQTKSNRAILKRTEDEPCDFCVAIVTHWEDVLTSNTTEEEFKQILEGLCRQSGKFKVECLALVDEYYLPVYNMLVSEFKPKEICAAIGLCGASSVLGNFEHPVWTLHESNPRKKLPLTPLLRSSKILRKMSPGLIGTDEWTAIRFEDIESPITAPNKGINVIPIGKTGVVSSVVSAGDSNPCVMCEFAVSFLHNMLEQTDTRKDIEDYVDKLCSLLPKTISEECEDYVEAYGEQVIEMLAQKMDPALICPMLRLCPASLEAELTPVKEDVSCVMCEFAMTKLQDMIKDKKTEETIRLALENLCSILPKTVRAECEVFVDTYTDQIIHLLINEFSPDQICIQLGLCKSKGTPLVELDATNQLPLERMIIGTPSQATNNAVVEGKTSPVCVLCEFAMVRIDEMLNNNATEDEVIRAVEFVCARLPGSIRDDCIGFIEEYGDAIIQLLVHQLQPNIVCQQLGLCKQPSFSGLQAVAEININKCSICEELVNYVDKLVKDGDATIAIDSALEKVCQIFPELQRETCRSVIEVYGPYIVNLLAELGDSKSVCTAIKLCKDASSIDNQLLGAKKCTWGPSYWCQTQLHAAACKAEAHCEENVWKGIKPEI